MSPINFVTDDDPPVLMIHGDEDSLVPLSNSERMGEPSTGVGVTNKVVVLAGAGHGFRNAHRDRARDETLAFLTAQLATDRE